MRSLNQINLIGNLGGDPELRYTSKGVAVCEFSIATNTAWKVDGETKEQVEWHKVIAWRKLGEIASSYLKKGSKVFVSGKMQYRTYQDKNDQRRDVAEVVADELIFLDPKDQSQDLAGMEAAHDGEREV